MSVTILQALDFIYKNTKTKALKILPLEQALDFILAEDIYATHNLPPYNNSAMDGYAVKILDAGKCVKVEHTIFAGDDSSEVLTSGYAIKIMTGARIPEGCECIVPKEDTKECQDGVILPQNLSKGKHIRLCGEDIKKENLLLQKGQRLQAHQITLLASQGISHIKVHKKPRLALFASGNELKMHFEQVESHQLYNTNTPTLLARAKELGCEVEFIGTAEDTLDDLKEHIKSALNSDLIVTSGGASVGDADFTKEAFSFFGMETFFDKVEIKPGKPTAFGKIGNTFILNLPGNPLAATLNFELFGGSIILALSGAREKYLKGIDAKMQSEYRLKKGRISLVPGTFNGSSFEPCKKFAPGMVSPLANSNSYIMIDAGIEVLKKDEKVKVIPLRFSFTTDKQESLL
ncbi:molybdenum cofactor biosynthesis protein MoeA [Sulfurimonas hongkongensis]|uniref:Molybdopterin molybdenumtransferase n=1 Tax=Sulfurimonas hongkongensis TaxID=1172190 RepID=T0JRS9_9BACT|nr:gephyrin-like molybdotransferase Glp [Sulfurimonas hongkongensis]EQB39572.1 molybdenum cofactor biosynthesis protein MoeA [Sulfurimonas hongkongensis]